jgi:hypothetical protein
MTVCSLDTRGGDGASVPPAILDQVGWGGGEREGEGERGGRGGEEEGGREGEEEGGREGGRERVPEGKRERERERKGGSGTERQRDRDRQTYRQTENERERARARERPRRLGQAWSRIASGETPRASDASCAHAFAVGIVEQCRPDGTWAVCMQ